MPLVREARNDRVICPLIHPADRSTRQVWATLLVLLIVSFARRLAASLCSQRRGCSVAGLDNTTQICPGHIPTRKRGDVLLAGEVGASVRVQRRALDLARNAQQVRFSPNPTGAVQLYCLSVTEPYERRDLELPVKSMTARRLVACSACRFRLCSDEKTCWSITRHAVLE